MPIKSAVSLSKLAKVRGITATGNVGVFQPSMIAGQVSQNNFQLM